MKTERGDGGGVYFVLGSFSILSVGRVGVIEAWRWQAIWLGRRWKFQRARRP
jgi:hypothetical protein